MSSAYSVWAGKRTIRGFDVLTTQATQTNTFQRQFVSLQLSYSTADVERGLFFAPEYAPIAASEPIGKATLLVVHGEVFVLEEQPTQLDAKPLTEESGLFQIVGLDVQL